jgi:hypothetical protein
MMVPPFIHLLDLQFQTAYLKKGDKYLERNAFFPTFANEY